METKSASKHVHLVLVRESPRETKAAFACVAIRKAPYRSSSPRRRFRLSERAHASYFEHKAEERFVARGALDGGFFLQIRIPCRNREGVQRPH